MNAPSYIQVTRRRRETYLLRGSWIPWVLVVLVVSGVESSRAQDEYEQWKKKEEASFQAYVEERDKEFARFLQHEWKQMQVMNGLVTDETPKPPDIPVYKPVQETLPPAGQTPQTVVLLPSEPIKETQVPRAEEPRIDAEKNRNHAKLLFYGLPVDIGYDDAVKVPLGQSVDKESISRFWENISRANYRDVLQQMTFYRHEMNLNDWGLLELVHAVGKEINHEENDAILFTWFMASKAGYETKVGYSGKQVCLLTATRNTLYAVPYFTFAGTKQRYYVAGLDPGWKLADEKIYTYDGSYPEAAHPVEFSVLAPPRMDKTSLSKTLKFSYSGERHDVPVRISRDAVRFFEYYPQANFEVYFDALPSTEATASLLDALRPLVRGKSEKEAVNLLLRFVQTAFRYKTDHEQFGREKPLFPDATLYYEYSDCEDRAVLFAYLVRTLTGLEVVGLDYPGHIATAVRFSDDIRGDALTYQGKKLVICDPTYENADAGCCMPAFKGTEPKIIRIGQQEGS